MQQYPTANKFHRQLRYRHHQLRHQYQGDERKIPVADAHIHQRLREERKDQLQQRTHQHPQQQLHKLLPVRKEILGKEQQPFSCLFIGLVLLLIELRRRFQCQCRPLLLAVGLGHQPTLPHFRFGIGHELRSRIGNVVSESVLPLADVVQHHEMVLVPVQHTWQRHILVQLLQGNAHAQSAETDTFRRIADAEH